MKYKFHKNRERISEMHSLILMIMMASWQWCEENNLPFVVTDTVSTQAEDFLLNRKSTTHLEGRAFDFSVKGWKAEDMGAYRAWAQERFKGLGAFVSLEKPDVVVDFHGEGENLHGHVQIHRKYFLNEWF